ncbi:helix-turn-helix transcriptional regulator [Methylomonas sp. UP202]|uniref:helix-turn-helix transcriptional regulator n=1 Tax=Methylomonas sp. UP202 TaxID=3040943 RepID=UPI002479444A|nr:helix-turn-helix transcriptional regulator [Methylomonas sp. UP202]WGS85980.1 helix-turn-helix transcriptional regulator [Methylomonas sp. UP202]
MRKSHALAYLRQICCSNLSSELITTEFLRAIPNLIQSNSNTFSVCDQQLRSIYHLTGFDLGYLAPAVPNVLRDHHTKERLVRVANWFRQSPTLDDPRIVDDQFYKSDVYNIIYRAFDMHYTSWIKVPINDSQVGVLGLYRSKNQADFSSGDRNQITSLIAYLSHAYQAKPNQATEYGNTASQGMLIMSPEGELIYQCPEAKRLIQLADTPRTLIDRRQNNRLLENLKKLADDLVSIHRGKESAIPAFDRVNPYGAFSFKGYWLNNLDSDSKNMIGVTVKYREPIELKLLRAVRSFPLSPTQKEVAMLLAKGISFEQIGRKLHIKQNTVKDHAGKIYLKLNIRQRGDLLPLLLSVNSVH